MNDLVVAEYVVTCGYCGRTWRFPEGGEFVVTLVNGICVGHSYDRKGGGRRK